MIDVHQSLVSEEIKEMVNYELIAKDCKRDFVNRLIDQVIDQVNRGTLPQFVWVLVLIVSP